MQVLSPYEVMGSYERRSPSREGAATGLLEQEKEIFLHFSLQGALQAGCTLALNTRLGTLSYLSSSNGLPLLIAQQQFSSSELGVLRPLLESFPHFCPYEVLFAHFYSSEVTDLAIAYYRRRLQEALETGTWDQEMRPVRNVLSRTRLKLQTFGITILCLFETGYILGFLSKPKSAEKYGEDGARGKLTTFPLLPASRGI
jgi:hypothetical protein